MRDIFRLKLLECSGNFKLLIEIILFFKRKNLA